MQFVVLFYVRSKWNIPHNVHIQCAVSFSKRFPHNVHIWTASFYHELIQCAFSSCLVLKSFSHNFHIWKASFYRKVIQCAFPSCLFLKSFSKNVHILKTSRFFSYLKPLNHLHSICTHFLVVDQCGAPILRCGLHKNIMDCFIPPDFFAISSWKMSLLFSGHRCRTEQGIMSNGICLIFLQFKYYLKLDPPLIFNFGQRSMVCIEYRDASVRKI